MFYIQAKVHNGIYVLKALLRHLLIRNSWRNKNSNHQLRKMVQREGSIRKNAEPLP